MTTVLRWRVLRDGPADGPHNMAVDHALALELVPGEAVLRLYEWAPATVSFGRNQPARGHFDEALAEERGLRFVRRPTGGRAVLHDRELTYCVVADARALGGARAAYRAIHEVLLDALVQIGVSARMAGDDRGAGQLDTSPCFADPAPGEIHVAGRKLVGSAQARVGGVLLQHGSLLTVNDQSALLELGAIASGSAPPTTLRELGAVDDPETLAGAVETSLARRWRGAVERGSVRPGERDRARALEGRYRDPEWTWRR